MIFLTGATGLVGSFILQELLKKDIEVRCLIRNLEDRKKFNFDVSRVEWVEGDLSEVDFIYKKLQDIDMVIHTAGLVSYSSKNSDQLDRINVEGTRQLVNMALESNIKRFCHLSSIAALGSSKQAEISESTPFDPNNYTSYYSNSKYLSELEVWRGSEEGLNTIIMNPTIVLGPRDWDKSSTKIFKYVYDEHKYYIGGGYNFLDVRDLAELTVRAAFSDIKNEQFIISGENVSYKELFEKIAHGFSKKPPTKKASSFAKRLLYYYSWIRSTFSGAEPLITKDAINKSEKFPEIDNSKIKEVFPHTYRNINETIAWCCSEILKQHQSK